MALLSKEALLGASDLTEKEVELPSIGGSVKVRALPALYSNEAQSKAIKSVTGPKGESTSQVDVARLEILQALHGLVEPRLNSEQEAKVFATNCGPAWREVIKAIDEISGVDKEAIEEANDRFQASGESKNGSTVGDDSPAGSR